VAGLDPRASDRGYGIPGGAIIHPGSSKKKERLAQEEKSESKRAETLERELNDQHVAQGTPGQGPGALDWPMKGCSVRERRIGP